MIEIQKVQLKQTLIVGIHGKAGSGKDTFADLLVSDYGATKIPFAKAVKDEVEEFLINNEIYYKNENLWGSQSDKEEEFLIDIMHLKDLNKNDIRLYDLVRRFGKQKMDGYLLSYRTLLQLWGTEYRRTEDDNYWVKKAFSKCRDRKIYVLSDVRFPNEYNAVYTPHCLFNGFTVKITGRQSNISGMEHPSETSLDHLQLEDWDYTIVNNRTYNEFLNECRMVINDILKKVDI